MALQLKCMKWFSLSPLNPDIGGDLNKFVELESSYYGKDSELKPLTL